MGMKAIVTTTVNPPTEALRRFASMPGWQLYVVGDRKTPHGSYRGISNIRYLSPHEQEARYPNLSHSIGWDCIQRRNIGFVEAFKDGAEIIATVDDDNIPEPGWGQDLLVGRSVELECYDNASGVFDPLAVTSLGHMWHRGYPPRLIGSRGQLRRRTVTARILVQADLWDGHPDVDAVCRIAHANPYCKLSGPFPYACDGVGIFNSQNTFLHRTMFPAYCVLPGADRMDDIWGGLVLQHEHRDLRPFLAYSKPSVVQDRNEHDLFLDLRRELRGSRVTDRVVSLGKAGLPRRVRAAYDAYLRAFE